MFADASRSGDDVFVVTRQQLVSSDQDDYVDLYDVRVGPGLSVPPLDTAPSCEGEGCQGVPSAPPGDDVVGSLTLEEVQRSGSAHAGLTVRHRARFRGAVGLLSVKLSAAGRIAWRGRGLVSGSLRRGSAGTARLRLRLGRSARVRLTRSGEYATAVRLTFHAAEGGKATRIVHVTFKTRQRKGR
jgi:hypothetical protein